jgi:hypothetical protein
MKTSNLLLQYAVLTGIGPLTACVLWASTLVAQTAPSDDAITPPITSAPDENSQGDDAIDYENAQPIPMPSLPDPAPSDNFPVPPSTGGNVGHPGSTPGATGTGEENPRVVVPPKPLSEIAPPNSTDSADKKCKNPF